MLFISVPLLFLDVAYLSGQRCSFYWWGTSVFHLPPAGFSLIYTGSCQKNHFHKICNLSCGREMTSRPWQGRKRSGRGYIQEDNYDTLPGRLLLFRISVIPFQGVAGLYLAHGRLRLRGHQRVSHMIRSNGFRREGRFFRWNGLFLRMEKRLKRLQDKAFTSIAQSIREKSLKFSEKRCWQKNLQW